MKHWILWLLAGILSLIGGFVALMNPLAATFAAEQLAGWLFLMVGALTVAFSFVDQSWRARIWSLLLGIALLLVGVSLVAHPLKGMLSLTFIAGILILSMGLLRIVLAFSAQATGFRAVLILSGLISLALGAMIFANWPQSASVLLGAFLAIDLISNGVYIIALSLARRSEATS